MGPKGCHVIYSSSWGGYLPVTLRRSPIMTLQLVGKPSFLWLQIAPTKTLTHSNPSMYFSSDVHEITAGCFRVFPKNHGTPKWMGKIMENPIFLWDDLGVFPYFWKLPYSNFQFYNSPSPRFKKSQQRLGRSVERPLRLGSRKD